MAILRSDPFKDLISIQDRMNKLFEDTLFKARGIGDGISGVWSPLVDVYETENDFVFRAELPGLDQKDIVVEVEENMLILKGERKFMRDVKEENYIRAERSYGKFYRTFNLPGNVISNKVSAKFKEGILEIVLPKTKEGKGNIIKVNVE